MDDGLLDGKSMVCSWMCVCEWMKFIRKKNEMIILFLFLVEIVYNDIKHYKHTHTPDIAIQTNKYKTMWNISSSFFFVSSLSYHEIKDRKIYNFQVMNLNNFIIFNNNYY